MLFSLKFYHFSNILTVDPLEDGKNPFESKLYEPLSAFELVWMAEALGCFHSFGYAAQAVVGLSYTEMFKAQFPNLFFDDDQIIRKELKTEVIIRFIEERQCKFYN